MWSHLLVTGSWTKRILWSASVSPNGTYSGGFLISFYLIPPLCLPHNKSIVIRAANGGRVTNQSLINLNPGIEYDKREQSL